MYSYKNLTKSTNNMKKVKIIQNSDETTDLLKKENKNSLIITNVTQYVNDKISNDRYSNKKYYNINNNANDSEKHSQDNKKLVYEKEKQIFVAKNTKKIISKNKNREHEIIYGASIKKADKNIKINSTNIKTNQNKQSSIIYGNIYTNKQINSKNNVQLNESGIIYGRKYDGIHVNTSPSRIRKNEIDNYDIIYGSRNKKSKKYILERSFEEKATKVADIINSKKVTENHDYSYLTDSTRDQSDRFCNKFKKNAKNKKIKPVKKREIDKNKNFSRYYDSPVLSQSKDYFINSKSITQAAPDILFEVGKELNRQNYVINQFLSTAKIPILKIKNSKGNNSIDISANQFSSIVNTLIISNKIEELEILSDFIKIIKEFCDKNQINSAYKCTLSSYAIVLMAIFYFQKRKLLAPFHEKGKFIKRNNISIGSEIVGFLDFYGNKMDFNKYAICVKTGRLIMKADCKFNVNMSKYNFNMCIIDPVVNNFNVTKSVTAETLRQIVNVFQECHKKIIGGDLSGFR